MLFEDAGGFGAQILVVEQRLERLARAVVCRIEEEDLAVVLERARRIARGASRACCRGGT